MLENSSDNQQPAIWPFVTLIFGVPVIAVLTGHFFASVFIGAGLGIPLVLYFWKKDFSASEVLGLACISTLLVGFGILFIIPWGSDGSYENAREKLLSENSYSCHAEHYDRENCLAQKRGLDAIGKLVNQQGR